MWRQRMACLQLVFTSASSWRQQGRLVPSIPVPLCCHLLCTERKGEGAMLLNQSKERPCGRTMRSLNPHSRYAASKKPASEESHPEGHESTSSGRGEAVDTSLALHGTRATAGSRPANIDMFVCGVLATIASHSVPC